MRGVHYSDRFDDIKWLIAFAATEPDIAKEKQHVTLSGRAHFENMLHSIGTNPFNFAIPARLNRGKRLVEHVPKLLHFSHLKFLFHFLEMHIG
ncbi:hypothetical protein U879_01885 [Defluviimonas sp. 20V17]|nr:hypothetical protein U879_01885 [Defluviimonas sp. 20V17]